MLLEKNNKLGKKLLATGNGRCNIMNAGAPVYFGDAAFAGEVLSFCPPQSVKGFLEGLGLVLRQEEGGRVYPAGNRADMVLDAFVEPLAGSSVQVLLDAEAVSIEQLKDGWRITTAKGDALEAPSLILAGGGCAAPKLGGSDSMYTLARSLGFSLVAPWPALCALETERKPLKGLSGLRLIARLTLLQEGQPVDAAQGEALFSDTGISGVCAMQLARAAGQGLQKGAGMALSLDFSPALGLTDTAMERKEPQPPDANYHKVLKWLKLRRGYLAQHRLLSGALPKALADCLQASTLEQIARNLSDWRLQVQGVRGFDHAQVAAGGISTQGLNPQTMESPLKSLFLTGELLNVDGDTGGHNLMFALATGILAGESVGG